MSIQKIQQKLLLVLLCTLTSLLGFTQTLGLITHTTNSLDNGYVLFAPMTSNTTYLIDKCGRNVKTWNSTYLPGVAVYLLPNGNLLRTGNTNNTTFKAGGQGGIIEIIDWNNNIIWSYTMSDSLQCSHHDIRAMPNGNILAIVWENKSKTESIAQGRDSSKAPNNLWSEKIIEIQPTGSTTGNIVWEWHLWDHLVQDFDITKPNFGTVSTNPQLLNINYAANDSVSDWIHLNSIDYNANLDQIMIGSHTLNEIWIIDHSTSTAVAATHTGGNSNKGGDFIYRWGNPAAYNNGTLADQKLFKQHNAHWIEAGLPHANQILIYNNGVNRPGGDYSTVEIITPPVSGYNYVSTLPYLPATNNWIYNDGNPNKYYAPFVSGAQQLANGNVLLCNGPIGLLTEVDSNKNLVWKYINPVSINGILTQNSNPNANPTFRCTFYPLTFSGFTGHAFLAENPIEDYNNLTLSCTYNTYLPLNLLSFTGKHQDNLNVLQWTTEKEINTDHFEILRSEDGKKFNKIGENITVSGNSTNYKNYTFYDNNVQNQAYYYQLKTTDRDNKYSLSNVINIASTNKTEYLVYPNPASDYLKITNSSSDNTLIEVQLINETGQTILNPAKIKPLSTYTYNLVNLKSGVYYLKINSHSNVELQKIIIVK